MKQGILLHISSLTSSYGIGDFGPQALRFVDYLSQNAYNYWQILPVNYPGYGNSPYNPISTFAINPYLISPEILYDKGIIDYRHLISARLPMCESIDYPKVISTKNTLFETIKPSLFEYYKEQLHIDNIDPDLRPFLCFQVLKELYGCSDWSLWSNHRAYKEDIYYNLYQEHKERMSLDAALQLEVSNQFRNITEYAHSKDIHIIGDMPIYLSMECSEVWANKDVFKLDENAKTLAVAGVPPDAFSEDGQLWGNPVYDWDRLEEREFDFIIKRIESALKYIDVLRLDHFIGYVNYWEVAAGKDNAKEGEWVRAKPEQFFDRLFQMIDSKRIIAEDLGVLNDNVCHIRDVYGLPGMIVLQFCFDNSVPCFDCFPEKNIIYTGTHDNMTTRQWLEQLDTTDNTYCNLLNFLDAKGYINNTDNIENILDSLIAAMHQSPCQISIVPMQDILKLGSSARMNIPGVALGNWEWRMTAIP